MELVQPGGSGGGGTALTVSDGITTVTNVSDIVFSGATVSNGGGGIADVTITGGSGTVTSVSGTTNRITVANGTTTPVIDISASYIGQSSITTLGTITTGVWNGTTISLAKGGTGSVLSDPGADRLWGWDDTDNAINFWTIGSGLSYDHATHTISATGGGGGMAIGGTVTSGTTGSILFVGSGPVLAQDNANFFWNNSTKRLGIGTATPGAALDVAGNGSAHFITGDAGVGTNYAGLALSGTLSSSSYNLASGSSDTNLYVNRPSGKSIIFQEAGATNQMAIITGGNVGVGTTAPTRMVQVLRNSTSGTISDLPTISVGNSHVSTGIGDFSFSSFELMANNGGMTGEFFADGSGNFDSGTPNLYFRTATNHPMLFGTNSIVRMTIDAGGNIGIGTTSPTARLNIAAGTATAGTAPIKLTAGTLLTTPELGALEYTDNGTIGHLYFTVNVAGVITRVQII